jgi:hypothetical protein
MNTFHIFIPGLQDKIWLQATYPRRHSFGYDSSCCVTFAQILFPEASQEKDMKGIQ